AVESERGNVAAELPNVTPLFQGQTVFVRESPIVVLHPTVNATEPTRAANGHRWHSGYVVAAGINSLEANLRYHITAVEGFLTGLRCAILNKIGGITKAKNIDYFWRKDVRVRHDCLAVVTQSGPERTRQSAGQD